MIRRPVGARAGRVALVAVLVLVLAGSAAAGPLAVVAHRALIGPAYHRDGLLTFLIIGSDIGPPHRPGNPLRGRADALHLVAVDPRSYRATIVDFPRDSLIAGRKVTEHLYRGGPEHVRAVLQDYTGIPIDFWALTTFRGLENLVTGMGGIDVVVDQPMRDAFSGSDFAPGPQRLNGGQALAFARPEIGCRRGLRPGPAPGRSPALRPHPDPHAPVAPRQPGAPRDAVLPQHRVQHPAR